MENEDINQDSWQRSLIKAIEGRNADSVKDILEDIGANLTSSVAKRALILAISIRCNEVVDVLLDTPAVDPHCRDSFGRTALMHAAARGHIHAVHRLLKSLDLNVKDMYGYTALDHALANDNADVASAIFRELAKSKNKSPQTPLMRAAYNGDAALVKKLLASSYGGGVNVADKYGKTALMIAVEKQHSAVIKLLLAAEEMNVNATDMDGKSALIIAASMGFVHVVKRLLAKSGIKANQADILGKTALMHASAGGYLDVVQVQTKAEGINAKDKSGRTALIHASDRGHLEIAAFLLNISRVDANICDECNHSALTHAAAGGHYKIVALLVERPRVKVNVRSFKGLTPLIHAVIGRHKLVVERLLKRVDLEINTLGTDTALLRAVANKDFAITKLLLEDLRTNVNVRNIEGKTAFECYEFTGADDVIILELFLQRKACTACLPSTDVMTKALVNLAVKHKSAAIEHAHDLGHSMRDVVMNVIYRNDAEAMKLLLLSCGSKVQSVFMEAVKNNNVSLVQKMLQLKFLNDINCRDSLGKTALMYASLGGYFKVIVILLEQLNIDIDAKDEEGQSAFDMADNNSKALMLAIFLSRDIDSANIIKLEVVMLALRALAHIADKVAINRALSEGVRLDKVIKIMADEADINAVSTLLSISPDLGAKILTESVRSGQVRIVESLLAAKVTGIDSKDFLSWGYTPVITAARDGHVNIVRALVEAGAEINATSFFGHNALSLAIANNRVNVVKFLAFHIISEFPDNASDMVRAAVDKSGADNVSAKFLVGIYSMLRVNWLNGKPVRSHNTIIKNTLMHAAKCAYVVYGFNPYEGMYMFVREVLSSKIVEVYKHILSFVIGSYSVLKSLPDVAIAADFDTKAPPEGAKTNLALAKYIAIHAIRQ